MEGYSAKVTYCSKELTAKEKVALKDTSFGVQLDEATKDNNGIVISPLYYAVIEIHNERGEDKDYKKYVVVDRAGERYVTGSQSFFESFVDIFDDMAGEEEECAITVYRVPSKNYKGKEFLTCSIVL